MAKTIKIRNKTIGPGHPTLIIAETACSHNGSFEEAKQMIDASVEAKADMIHFILFSTEKSMCPKHPDYEFCQSLELNQEQWAELINYTRTKDILIAATVEDELSLKLASQLPIDILKIHSTDNTNPEFIRAAAKQNKPMMLSVGAMTFEEIERAIEIIKKEGVEDIILMYGYQNYPTKPEKTNLLLLKTLKEKFDLPVGYADHTDGSTQLAIYLPIMTIPMGADVIDKHITLDRSMKGADYQAAINCADLKKFIENVRLIEKAMGDGKRKEFTEEEKEYRTKVKKSIVAARDIKIGDCISRKDIEYKRTNILGLAPYEANKIIGRSAKKDIKKFDNLSEEDLQ